MNSLSQGGLPVDVAETIAWFAAPGSTGRERQRRPRLRPEPARGLSVARAGRCGRSAGCRRCCRSTRRGGVAAVPGAGLLGRLPLDPRRRAATISRPSGSAIDGRRGRPRRARRLLPGLRVHAARRAAADLPARPRLPAADGADGARLLPVPAARPRPRRQRDHPAPAARRSASRSTSRSAPTDLRPTRRAGVLADRRGARRRRRARLGGDRDDPPPRRRRPRRRARRRARSRSATTSRPAPSGGCPATSAAATPRSPATATRSTCTR